jgi:hypothetical protein
MFRAFGIEGAVILPFRVVEHKSHFGNVSDPSVVPNCQQLRSRLFLPQDLRSVLDIFNVLQIHSCRGKALQTPYSPKTFTDLLDLQTQAKSFYCKLDANAEAASTNLLSSVPAATARERMSLKRVSEIPFSTASFSCPLWETVISFNLNNRPIANR